MRATDAVALCLAVVAACTAGLRWLRVAQREHYLAGSTGRFAARWWRGRPLNLALLAAGVAGFVVSLFFAPAALLAAAAAALGPVGLGIRGRTSRLRWTRRLTTVAVTAAVLGAIGVLAGAVAGGLGPAAAASGGVALAAPVVLDAALALTRPFENLLADRFVRKAEARLAKVQPIVVGVTGSYGKTTTKGYVAHLLGPYRATLPSPQSFNNRAGLARTVNEHVGPGTEVLVAEMGTYGPGEIAAMCAWLRPEIAVITAIGPAHLERFRTLDRTLAAKAEITETARAVVLNVDDPRLRGLAEVLRVSGQHVIGASGTSPVADVSVVEGEDGLELRLGGRLVGLVATAAADRPTALSNAACAAAVALELGIIPEDVLTRLPTLPVPPNRLQRYEAAGGYVVLDDTFNSNPTGARLALARLQREAPDGQRVVVTPGMVELGPTQFEENAGFAEAAARVATELVVVANTNRRALSAGAARVPGGAVVVTAARLDEAVDHVRASLGPGDAVLYENDLPDHFP